MRIRSEVRVLGLDRLRGKREQKRGKGRRPEFDQAGSDTAIGARMSGTIGSSGG
jgi:hypothetical protein